MSIFDSFEVILHYFWFESIELAHVLASHWAQMLYLALTQIPEKPFLFVGIVGISTFHQFMKLVIVNFG